MFEICTHKHRDRTVGLQWTLMSVQQILKAQPASNICIKSNNGRCCVWLADKVAFVNVHFASNHNSKKKKKGYGKNGCCAICEKDFLLNNFTEREIIKQKAN